MPDDLKVLFPGREIKVGDETIKVRPFYFGEYQQALALLQPLLLTMNTSGLLQIGKDGSVHFTTPEDWPLKLVELVVNGGEPLYAFLGFAINKPREWFNTIGGDDGIEVTKAVFAENASFFEKRIAPKFQALILGGSGKPDGELSSQNLPPLDTPGTQSVDTPSIN